VLRSRIKKTIRKAGKIARSVNKRLYTGQTSSNAYKNISKSVNKIKINEGKRLNIYNDFFDLKKIAPGGKRK
jgi:hypothetical protein